jgi:hypothetical protein
LGAAWTPFSQLRRSGLAAMIDERICTVRGEVRPNPHRRQDHERTMRKKETRVSGVTEPPNQRTSPYAIRMMVRFLKMV